MVGRAGRGRLQATKILFQISNIVPVVAVFEIVGDGLKVDTVLGQERLIFPEPVDQIPLVWLLLPPAWRLRRHHATLDPGLDAVGAGLLFVATHLPLLTEDT